jgi:crotonobetainyl-CoA:carnitine CoA-transferase CaiB-like acyl-CoA transferase
MLAEDCVRDRRGTGQHGPRGRQVNLDLGDQVLDCVANREATDALVAAWTCTLGKMEAFAIAKRHRIPLAPVRDVDEVMRDRHLHERGMLEWIEHDEIGRIGVPTTPLRIHSADRVETVPSPKLGQHSHDIYGDWLRIVGRRDRLARTRRCHLSRLDSRQLL